MLLRSIWQSYLATLPLLSAVRYTTSSNAHISDEVIKANPLSKTIGKFIKIMGATVIDSFSSSPTSFLCLCPSYLEFAYTQVVNGIGPERHLISCLTLLNKVLNCDYPDETSNQIQREFYLPRLKELYEALITKYFLLTEADLREWDESPEIFAIGEDIDNAEVKKKSCAEVLYASLIKHLPQLVPIVVASIQNSQGSNLQALLCKDACYAAAQHAVYDLWNDIQFSDWFASSLIYECQNTEPAFKIIHRRIALLVAHWVNVLTPQSRISIYDTMMALLRTSDIVVRMAAAYALESSKFS